MLNVSQCCGEFVSNVSGRVRNKPKGSVKRHSKCGDFKAQVGMEKAISSHLKGDYEFVILIPH